MSKKDRDRLREAMEAILAGQSAPEGLVVHMSQATTDADWDALNPNSLETECRDCDSYYTMEWEEDEKPPEKDEETRPPARARLLVSRFLMPIGRPSHASKLATTLAAVRSVAAGFDFVAWFDPCKDLRQSQSQSAVALRIRTSFYRASENSQAMCRQRKER